jgi:hypothetical protein
MVYKIFDKNWHHLVLSDLDPTDKMNYKYDFLNKKFFFSFIFFSRCIKKITLIRVLDLLYQIKNTEATISYLELIKSVFAVYFIRIWRQHLNDNKISINHFLTV